MNHTSLSLSLFCALTLSSALAFSQAATPDKAPLQDLKVRRIAPGSVKIDGFVTDWQGIPILETRALTRGEPEYDWTGPRDLSLLVQAQHDNERLYLAVEVRDNLVVAPKRSRKTGDRVEIWIDAGEAADPSTRLRMLELQLGDMLNDGPPRALWFYPNKLAQKVPEGLEIDGSIRKTGYFFELSLPLSSISSPSPGLEPLKIAFIARDWDRDDPNEDEAAVATSPFDGRKHKKDPAKMGSLYLHNPDELLSGFYKQNPTLKDIPHTQSAWKNVGGDGRREFVSLIHSHLLIVGQGLGEGDFYIYDFPGSPHHTFKSFTLQDLTGDGASEILVRYEVESPSTGITQEIDAILHYDADKIRLIYQREVGNRGPGWSITNQITYKKTGKTRPSKIVVGKGRKTGKINLETYTDVDKDLIVNWDRILLPWQSTKKQTYTWDSGQFLKK